MAEEPGDVVRAQAHPIDAKSSMSSLTRLDDPVGLDGATAGGGLSAVLGERVETDPGFLFDWYNLDHRHSEIAMHTPFDVHFGLAEHLREMRADVLTAPTSSTLSGSSASHPDP